MNVEAGSGGKKISTTQLAKRAAMESRDLFELMSGSRWIVRNEPPKAVHAGKPAPKWLLTTKGEFEGGEYFESDKFGTYIVWPEALLQHPMILGVEQKTISATALGKPTNLSGRLVNHALAEAGWLEHRLNGWELTEEGRRQGGKQCEHEKSGAYYALWPKSLAQHPRLQTLLMALDYDALSGEATAALDCHEWPDPAQRLVDNWLYLSGLVHACRRPLPFDVDSETDMLSDFYLPQGRVFIECWASASSPSQLSEKLRKLELYQRHKVNLIEIEDEHLKNLDEYLARQLLHYGVKVYA